LAYEIIEDSNVTLSMHSSLFD